MNRRRDVILIALLALVANFVYFFYSNGDYTYPDSKTYITPAQNLLHGRGYTGAEGYPETIRTPIYPLILIPFLAATASLAPIVIVQHLINVALAIAIYSLARRRLNRFVALLAAIIFALDVPSIHYANKVLTETLFTALLWIVWGYAGRASARPALLTGLLVLLRPVAIVYFAIVAFFFPTKRRIAVFVALSLVFPLAWAIRNRVTNGVFTVSSVAGLNMLLHRAAGALAMIDAGEFKDDLNDRQQELLGDANDELAERYHVDDAMDLDPAIRSAYYAQAGRRIALRHPIGLAMLTARGVLVNFFDSDWEAILVVSPLDASLIQYAMNAWTHAVTLLAIIGIILMWNHDRRLTLLIAATVVYFLFISAGSEAEARFRVPVMPQMAIAAAYAVFRMKAVR